MDTTLTKLVVLLFTAASLAPSFTSSVKKVNNCSCQRDGNKYIQLAEEKCEKFTQYDDITRLTHTHRCPPGLRFNVDTCVCERSREVACEGCGKLVCEVEFDKRFEEITALERNGECQRANDIINDLIARCVVNNPVARILIVLRTIAHRVRQTQCPQPFLGEGCDRLPFCMTLLIGPENGDNTIKFLCENLKAAEGCMRCVQNKGCQIVKEYQNNLRDAVAELCPHLQEFTCPAAALT